MEELNANEAFLSIKRMAGLWPAPVAIMAAGRIGPNNWWGECSVFIPEHFGNPPKAYHDFDAGISGSALPSDVEIVDAAYMRLELKQKATEFLRDHISPIAQHLGQRDLLELGYQLHDGSKMDIYNLTRNGAFLSEVQGLAKQTKHDTLRGYLAAITKNIAAKIESTPKKPSLYE
jgi:hypothetical protein